jgi:hypothetical protein
MGRLRSARGDRWLIVSLWLLTAAVLAVGVAAGAVILLVWGALGLPAAAFVTYVYLRDLRDQRGPGAGTGAGAAPARSAHSRDDEARDDREPLEEETS